MGAAPLQRVNYYLISRMPPCAFPLFALSGNHSSTTIVNGQSFSDWFKDTYIFDAQGTSPLVTGFYFDDYIPPSGGFP